MAALPMIDLLARLRALRHRRQHSLMPKELVTLISAETRLEALERALYIALAFSRPYDPDPDDPDDIKECAREYEEAWDEIVRLVPELLGHAENVREVLRLAVAKLLAATSPEPADGET